MEDQQDQHGEVIENELERGKELDDLALPLVTQNPIEQPIPTTTASRQTPLIKQSSLASNGAKPAGTEQTDEWVGRHQGNKNSVSALVQRFNQMAEGNEKGVESSKN